MIPPNWRRKRPPVFSSLSNRVPWRFVVGADGQRREIPHTAIDPAKNFGNTVGCSKTMKTSQREIPFHPAIFGLRPMGLLVVCVVLSLGPLAAQTTVSSAEVDLYHSAFVVDGTLDVDNPPPESTFGVDMWNGSASSSGTGSFTSTGNYTSEVTAGYFSLSGTASNSKTGATSGGNGVAAAALEVEIYSSRHE